MGVSNIRNARDLLDRAGRAWDAVALIPEPLMKGIYIESRPIPGPELQEHADKLVLPDWDYGVWRPLTPAYSGVTTAPTATPKATLTPGLSRFWRSVRATPVGQEEPTEPDGLVFVAVVQGLAGSATSKTIKRHSRIDIGTAIYHELIMGFSTVFTGAFLATELKMNHQVTFDWCKADSVDQLREIEASNGEGSKGDYRRIGIIC